MIDFQFSSLAGRLKRSEIRELLKLTQKPDMISFGGGLPDPILFPLDAVREASIKAIDERGNLALQYSPTEGDPFLQEQIALFMQRQGEKVNAKDILITASSQQALDLIGKVFIDPGAPVIVEMPTYLGTIQAFRMYNAEFHGIEMDYEGVIPEKLEREVKKLCQAGRKPRFIYLIPDFQNPSGITLSLSRRKQVLEIASEYDLLVVEDSPYREVKFEGDLIPSLYSLDSEGRVLYTKTLSKIFCPGFRLGWMIGPAPVIDRLVVAKQGTDLCTSAYVSTVAAYVIKEGYLESQIEKSKKLYARKAAVMFEALEKFMPPLDGLSWSKPIGGMFMWIKLPEYMDALELLMDTIKQNVAYVIGSAFHHDGSGKNTLRINYSYPSEEKIVTGVKCIAKVIEQHAMSRKALAG
jgi:2-aminoadipate transaminase